MANNQETKLTKDTKYNDVFGLDDTTFEIFPGHSSIKELFNKVESIVDKINSIDDEQYAKKGISSSQESAIVANTAKTGITTSQANAITANTAKTGITTSQASAITSATSSINNINAGRVSAIMTNINKVTAQVTQTVVVNSRTGAATLNKSILLSNGTRYTSTETLTKVSK